MRLIAILSVILSVSVANVYAVNSDSSSPVIGSHSAIVDQAQSLDNSPITTINSLAGLGVIASTERGGLFLYNGRKWTSLGKTSDNEQISQVAFISGQIYVLSTANNLYVVNYHSKKWQILQPTKNIKVWDIAANANSLYIAGVNSDNYLLKSGKLQKLPQLDIKSIYVSSDQEVYAGSSTGDLYRYSQGFLAKGWQKVAGLDGYSKPLWSINKSSVLGVIAGTDDGNIVRYDKDTDSLQPIGNPILSQFDHSKVWYLQSDANRVYTVTDNGSLYIYSDGYWKKHEITVGSESDVKVWSIYLSGNILYVGTETGMVIAYNLKSSNMDIL